VKQRSSPLARVLLVCRLAERDMRHRPAAAVLLLIAITAATTTLTLGLALGGVTGQHYATTRAATAGPDVVAATVGSVPGGLPADLARLEQLSRAPGVTGHSGPFPVTFAALRAGGRTANVMAEGRDQEPASVDQPQLTQGGWVRPGEVVVERTFADVLGIRAGDRVTLDGRSFRVAGIAVTAAVPPYPNICYFFGCGVSLAPLGRGNPGLVWLTGADARSLASRTEPLSYLLNVKLAHPASAGAFANAYDARYGGSSTAPVLYPWQSIQGQDGQLVMNEQQVLLTGSLLLGLLAVASVAVLVGGRMAEQIRRVGLLKAVGSTPGLVGAVLLAEHLVTALAAAAIGLVAGWLAAPLVTAPGADLLGSATAPPVTMSTIGLVAAVALAVAVVATVIPAIRAARTSTVAALADAARPPRRRPWLIAISARLPVPFLLGLRLAARRPRRTLLSGASVAVAVSGIVAVLYARVSLERFPGGYSGLDTELDQVLLVVTVALIVLAAVNAILIAWATVLDTRHTSALTRSLGATPQQVSTGLAAGLVLPALAGALLAIPAGMGLFVAVAGGATLIRPPTWWLVATVLGTVVAVAALTVVPCLLGARRPVAEILASELA
jgi:ABC-type lipoprotein release transport system permease subunit